jgi:hypothetical protein
MENVFSKHVSNLAQFLPALHSLRDGHLGPDLPGVYLVRLLLLRNDDAGARFTNF